MRRLAPLLGALTLFLVSTAGPAAAQDDTIPLPNGFQPEGLAVNQAGEFFVGSLADGSIYKGDVRSGQGGVLTTPTDGRATLGLHYDEPSGRLFAAGGPGGGGYIYDGDTGAEIASFDLDGTFVNDVVTTRNAAYFTDSMENVLHVVPLDGQRLPDIDAITSLPLGGDFVFVPGAFNGNGIAASGDGSTLIVGNSTVGSLYLVDAATGVATLIDLGGAGVPNADGILLVGRTLFVVQNFLNQVSVIRMSPDLSSGSIGSVIASDEYQIPTALGSFGKSLFAVNARFDVAPPFGDPVPDVEFDIVVTGMRGD